MTGDRNASLPLQGDTATAQLFADQTEAEAAVMERHVSYWMGQLAEGRAVAFGPVLERGGVWGLGVIEVTTEAEAQRLRDGDPVVTSDLATVEIHLMPGAVARPHISSPAAAESGQ